MKKVLYISPLSSKRLTNDILLSTGNNFIFAVQKFNRLVAQGLALNNTIVEIYSKPPVNEVSKREWVSIPDETEDGLTYSYISFLNVPIIKDIIVFLKAFVKVLKFGFSNKKDRFVICDILSVSLNLGAVLASKICGVNIVGIVTDMPGLMVESGNQPKKTLISRLYSSINKLYISCYTHYVFLTEQMNTVINIHGRPYIVIEALCDISSVKRRNEVKKSEQKIIMYAGGLHEKYGLKLLVEGFMKLKRQDIKLIIYGSGPFTDELIQITKVDSRVEYRGIVTNEEIIRAELEAFLLVNPRPTNEEFTQYSFPSKNMEYMVSGTPLLTTKLPGIPKEYYPYVYFFEDESVEGYATTINYILNLSSDELSDKGEAAKNFVLKYKNHKTQAARIVDMLQKS